MTEAEKEAREEAERRWPDWVCPPVDDPEPDYSELDARWQNADSEMQRNAFVAGAAWQASRASQPTDDEWEALRLAVQGVLWNASNYPERVQPHLLVRDVRPLTESVMVAILAAGFRRAPAEPAVTDEMVEAFTVAINRAGYVLDRDATRVGLRAALTTKEGQDR